MPDNFYSLSSMATEIAVHLHKELDEPFKRLLAQSIDSWRSRLLRNSLQDKPNESKFFRQTLYAKMIDADPTPECIGMPGCMVRRTEKKIPVPVRYGTQLFDYVGSADGKVPFSERIPGMAPYQGAGRYSGKIVFWAIENGYGIVEGRPNLPYMRFDGIFDKPSEVMEFNCDGNEDCDFWEQPYPVTGDIAQQIMEFIKQSFLPPPVAPDKDIEVTPQNQEHAPDGR